MFSSIQLQAYDLSPCINEEILFEGINFTLHTGDIMQLIGNNGSGKTSLLKILTGLTTHFQGKLYWNDQPLHNLLPHYRSRLLYLGHSLGLKNSLSVQHNLAWICGMSSPISAKAITRALDYMGLQSYQHTPCYALSAGQKRRVALTRLLLEPKSLWILDEPFTCLDQDSIARLEHLMIEHSRHRGSIVFTSHHPMNVNTPHFTQIVLPAPHPNLIGWI